jgi:hypothetical protein
MERFGVIVGALTGPSNPAMREWADQCFAGAARPDLPMMLL